MSSISLSKGQKVDLTKTNNGKTKYLIGLGWNANSTSTGGDFDVDVSAFILNDAGKLLSESHMVFYNNLKSPNDAVIHSGDNRTGQGDGDDESLNVDLSKVEEGAKSINFVVTIHDAQARGQNFGQISGAYIRVVDSESGAEVMRYDLNEDFSIETAMEFGKLYRHEGEWKFQAIGSGHAGGLQSFVSQFSA